MISPKYALRTALCLGLLCSGAVAAQADSLVSVNPTRVTGVNAINPAERTLTLASGATALATLQQRSDFAAIQNFNGFSGNINAHDNFIYNFTDTLLPAVRFNYGGTYMNSSVVINAGSTAIGRHSTSEGGASLRMEMAAASTMSLTIDFGSYNGTDGFSVSPLNSGVSAAAFTLSGSRADSISILYLDAAGNTLSSQSIVTSQEITYGYTGYQISADQAPIASIVINVASRAGYNTTLGFDDFFFSPTTVIPEASTVSLWAGAAALIICMASAKRRK